MSHRGSAPGTGVDRLKPVAVKTSGLLVADPVVEQALKTLTQSVNQANNLPEHWTNETPLPRCSYSMTAVTSLTHQISTLGRWRTAGQPRGALRLQKLAATIDGGKRPQLKHGSPFRQDILSIRRQEADVDG